MPEPIKEQEQAIAQDKIARGVLLTLAERIIGSPSMQERCAWLERNIATDIVERLDLPSLPNDFLLSVVMPVFNEVQTIERVVQRVLDIPLPLELVIVDDGSTDGTRQLLQRIDESHDEVRVLFHDKNQGKGGALKTGFSSVSGTHVVIQDADMEYDPNDYFSLLQPIVAEDADVVYGNRFYTSDSTSPWWHRKGNGAITWLSNRKTGQDLSDVETCYKMFRRDVLERISHSLRERGFGVEIEITAKLSKLSDIRVVEVPISYDKRGYAEGKKIGWRDGLWAMWCILRY